MIRTIGDFAYAIVMMAFEVVLFIKLIMTYDVSLGLFGQPFQTYLGIAILFIFQKTVDDVIKRNHERFKEDWKDVP